MKKVTAEISSSFEHRTKLVETILRNMSAQHMNATTTGIILTGDPGVGKCLTGENKIEIFVKDEDLLNEFKAFLNAKL